MGLCEALDALDEQSELDQQIPYTLTPKAYAALENVELIHPVRVWEVHREEDKVCDHFGCVAGHCLTY